MMAARSSRMVASSSDVLFVELHRVFVKSFYDVCYGIQYMSVQSLFIY